MNEDNNPLADIISENDDLWSIAIYEDDKTDLTDARAKYIEENPRCQLWYCILTADMECGIRKHPIEQMEQLGYKILDAVPQSIGDGWEFTVDKFIEPLPPYLRKTRYEIDETHKSKENTKKEVSPYLVDNMNVNDVKYIEDDDGTYTVALKVDLDKQGEKYKGKLILKGQLIGDIETVAKAGWEKVDKIEDL